MGLVLLEQVFHTRKAKDLQSNLITGAGRKEADFKESDSETVSMQEMTTIVIEF